MFILYAVIIGIIIGYAAKGRLRNIALRPLKWKYVPISALIIQLVIFSELPFVKNLPNDIITGLHFVSYVMLFIFMARNIKNFGVAIIGTGIFLNFLVISLNGGYMPTVPENLEKTSVGASAHLISQGEAVNNSIMMSEDTLLPWLGDIFVMPSWMPFSNVFSIGDIIIAIGICVFIVANMQPLKGKEQNA